MNEKCFCHLTIDGKSYQVKDSVARNNIETINEIIEDINTSIENLYVTNIETMKTLTLSSGNIVKTLGYYESNDGGSGTYLIRTKTDSDVIDNGTIHLLDNGLVAELIIENNTINIKQFGAYGDNEHIDNEYIDNALNFIKNSDKANTLYFGEGTYKINRSIVLDSTLNNVHITGTDKKKTLIYSDENIIYIDLQSGIEHHISNIGFIGKYHRDEQTAIGKSTGNDSFVARTVLEHLYFHNIKYGIKIFSGYFDSPIIYDMKFETVVHCMWLIHCESGTIQKIVAEPFIGTCIRLYQSNSCEIRDVLANAVSNSNEHSVNFIIHGSAVDELKNGGSNIKISNVHSEHVQQFALVCVPNVIFENIYLMNTNQNTQKYHTFMISASGGMSPYDLTIKNIVMELPVKDSGIADFYQSDINDNLTFQIPNNDGTITLNVGNITNLNVTGIKTFLNSIKVSIHNNKFDGCSNRYRMEMMNYSLLNGILILNNGSSSTSDIPATPSAWKNQFPFNHSTWNEGDRIKYNDQYIYKYSGGTWVTI